MNKPLPCYLHYSLALLWLWSGLQPALSAPDQSLELLARVGFQTAWQMPVFALSSALDVAFGIGCFTALRHRSWFWLAQWATVAGYSVIVAATLPEMWTHPFAPLVKNLPVMALMFWLFRQTAKPNRP